ncbi:TPA: hypothetical protein I8038_000254 [Legionella pneumophila]|nr:hypothetical protein [Legionella pneumophila]
MKHFSRKGSSLIGFFYLTYQLSCQGFYLNRNLEAQDYKYHLITLQLTINQVLKESSAATTNPNQRYRMSWVERLKRVFNIDITICQHCQGNVRIIACIKDKNIIDKILSHINKKPRNQEELLKTLPIRGLSELVSLITSNRTG